MPSVQKY